MDFLGKLWRAITGVWSLDPSMLSWFHTDPAALELSLTIALLAGTSTLLGNSVVLFLNHIRGWRFAASLIINAVAMVCLLLTQAGIVALVGWLIVGERVSFLTAATAVMLATAPLIFGVTELAPYLGPGIARVLQVWSLLALIGIVGELYQTGYWTAVLIAGLGWLTMQGLSWLLARPLTALGNAVWQLLSGSPTLISGHDLLAGYQFLPVEFDFHLSAQPEVER